MKFVLNFYIYLINYFKSIINLNYFIFNSINLNYLTNYHSIGYYFIYSTIINLSIFIFKYFDKSYKYSKKQIKLIQ